MMSLPKFLLASAEKRWCWFGFKQIAVPQPDGRWTLLRTLMLMVVSTLFTTGVGLALALAIWQQPVGWVLWLTALGGACFGLCWFGVTGLCWNQRAARLRANPALLDDLPKAQYPFFRGCLGFVYWVILGVLTPLALVVTIENVRGEIAWKRERAKLEAAGEKLTFREILGPAVPPEQNAGAAEVFAPFFEYEQRPAQQVPAYGGDLSSAPETVWLQSNRLAHLEGVFKTPSDYLPEGSRRSSLKSLIDVTNWSVAYRAAAAKPRRDDAAWASELKLPPPGHPAQDVLAGLSRADQELAEICAAATLPRAQFPVHYDEAFETLLRHLALLKGVQQTLQLRCAAHLAAGDTDAAFSDATNALNVAELLREEPLLISQLVRYGQVNITINTIWQGLAEHRWSDTQLQFFQQRLRQMEYLPGLLTAFEGERAGCTAFMDRFIQDPVRYGDFVGVSRVIRFLWVIPRSTMRQNQVALVDYETQKLEALREVLAAAPQIGLVAACQSEAANLEDSIPEAYSPYTIMVNMLVPAMSKAINRTARTQTTVEMAIVACALERYRLANGEFPESLDQLAQKYGEIPLDPMVNQPFHYQRTDDGWFQLYSVGIDGDDDGGQMASGRKDDKEEKDLPWPVPTRPEHPRLF